MSFLMTCCLYIINCYVFCNLIILFGILDISLYNVLPFTNGVDYFLQCTRYFLNSFVCFTEH